MTEVAEILARIEARPQPRDQLDLFIPDELTLDGEPIEYSAGMALIGDTLLAEGFLPAPFTVVESGRVYHFRVGKTGAESFPTLRSRVEPDSDATTGDEA